MTSATGMPATQAPTANAATVATSPALIRVNDPRAKAPISTRNAMSDKDMVPPAQPFPAVV